MTDAIASPKTPQRPAYLQSPAAKRLLIDGRWIPAIQEKVLPTEDPSTGEVLATLADGGAADIDAAVAAARAALGGPWGKLKPFDRQQLLLRLSDLVERDFEELAWIEAYDMGSPITVNRAGKRRAIGMLRFYAGMATTIHGSTVENSIPGKIFSYTVKEPIGVVGAITPWNRPLSQAIWKIAPALATGCTVVLKPAEQASLAPLRLGELFEEAGIPPGVINIVTGGREAGAALAAHPGVDKITFTGSTPTGQAIIRASAGNVKRLSLELGGKSPDIIFADADLQAAAAGAATAVFSNTGQLCLAGSRLFIQRSIYDEFVHLVAEHGRKLKVGSPLLEDTQLGPLASRQQLDRVTGFMASGIRGGATAVSGGARLQGDGLAQGCFVPPTVFSGVSDDMEIAREEIFGPVISALVFDDEDEVIRRANDTPFGLAGGLWTKDIARAHRVGSALQSGTVWINCYLPMDVAVPFGGYKMSGYGRESGIEHIEHYLNTKSLLLNVA